MYTGIASLRHCEYTQNVYYDNISNSKGLTETLRYIRTSTYQSWESEENNKLNNHIKQMNNYVMCLLKLKIYIYIIMWKRGEIAP